MLRSNTMEGNLCLNSDWSNNTQNSSLLDISAPDLSYLNNHLTYLQNNNNTRSSPSQNPTMFFQESTTPTLLTETENSLKLDEFCSGSGIMLDNSNNYLQVPSNNTTNTNIGLLNQMEIFKVIPVTKWEGQHCLDWGASVCKEYNIDLRSTNISFLSSLTGSQLLTMREHHFSSITDSIVGPLLYKNLKNQITKSTDKMSCASAMDSTTHLNLDYNTSHINYNTSNNVDYNSANLHSGDISPLHGSVSPVYATGFLNESVSPLHGSESPVFGSKSPYYSQSSACLSSDIESIIHDVMDNDNSQLEFSSLISEINDSASIDNEDCDTLVQNIREINLQDDFNLPELLLHDSGSTYNSRDVSPCPLYYQEYQGGLSPSHSLSPNFMTQSIEIPTQTIDTNQLQIPRTQTSTRPRRKRASGGARSSTSDSPCGSFKNNDFLKKIPTGPRNSRKRSPRSWEFLLRLLMSKETNPALIRWEDESDGVFRLIKKEQIAKMWADRDTKDTRQKNGSYESFARILRHHYKTGALEPVSEKHLVYRFSGKVVEAIKKGKCQ